MGDKDRILVIMPEYKYGGAEVQLGYLIDALERNNRKTDVFILHQLEKIDDRIRGEIPETRQFTEFYEDNMYGASEEELKWRINHFIVHNRAAGKEYYAAILFYPWMTVLISVLRKHGIAVIYSDRVSGTQVTNIAKYRNELVRCDILACNSMASKQRIETNLGRKVRLILNGKPEVKRLDYKKRKRIRNILVPANIDPRKNQKILIEFLDKFRDDKYKVRFIGKINSSKYMHDLRLDIEKRRLSENVDFAGIANNMENEYRNTDLVVLPSFEEGTPNVVLEAFAYGIPVVVSDIEAERELVKDSKFRFDPASVDELYSAIKAVDDLRENELEDMLRKNSKFIKENYGIHRMTDSFLELLDEAKRINLVDYDYEISEDVYRDISIMGNDLRKSREFYSILCDIVDVLQSGTSLSSYFEYHDYKKVSIYGFKELGRILKKELERNNIEICDIIDRDTTLGFPDIEIVPPDKAGKADVIIVTAIHYYADIAEEMRKKTTADIVSLKDVVAEVKEKSFQKDL